MTAGDKLGSYEVLGLIGKGGGTPQPLFPGRAVQQRR